MVSTLLPVLFVYRDVVVASRHVLGLHCLDVLEHRAPAHGVGCRRIRVFVSALIPLAFDHNLVLLAVATTDRASWVPRQGNLSLPLEVLGSKRCHLQLLWLFLEQAT